MSVTVWPRCKYSRICTASYPDRPPTQLPAEADQLKLVGWTQHLETQSSRAIPDRRSRSEGHLPRPATEEGPGHATQRVERRTLALSASLLRTFPRRLNASYTE